MPTKRNCFGQKTKYNMKLIENLAWLFYLTNFQTMGWAILPEEIIIETTQTKNLKIQVYYSKLTSNQPGLSLITQ